MDSPTRLLEAVSINDSPSTVMHIDLNSCFATIEQQANPLLRGRPVAVAAYTTANGCILAPSIEAKALGIKVGMRVREGKLLCPDLIVLPPDPQKYRFVNRRLLGLFRTYTPHVEVKSIDEMNLDFGQGLDHQRGLHKIGRAIKVAIRQNIGDWLTVSVGIAPNRYLAKLAASLHKPDGLDEIGAHNLRAVLSTMALTDLFGIKERNRTRLVQAGIHTPLDMLDASPQTLLSAFGGITGYYWHLRLRGWEIDDADIRRGSIGHSYALQNQRADPDEIARLISKLSEKVGMRMRRAGYSARGVMLSILYRDGAYWHKRTVSSTPLFASADIYRRAMQLYGQAPTGRPIHTLTVSCFELSKGLHQQLSFLADEQKKRRLTQAIDAINQRWGDFTIIPARMIGMEGIILDRIAFGSVKDLDSMTHQQTVGHENL